MRLFVTGPTGSGKTTLADRLAARMGAPLHSLDDMHWEPTPQGDRRRDPVRRAAMLLEVVQGQAWIVEGVQFKWADSALERADLILVLDLPRWRSRWRIVLRNLHRRLSGDPRTRGTWAALRQEFQWSADYYGHERALLAEKLAPFGGRVVWVESSDAALALVERRIAPASSDLSLPVE